MAEPITYVGLDVHKETIAVSLATAGERGEVREYGTIANTPTALRALAIKLAGAGATLRFCYEAGPCGYGIQRQLSGAGCECGRRVWRRYRMSVSSSPSTLSRSAAFAMDKPSHTMRLTADQ